MSTDPDSQQEASDPEASQQPDQGDKSIDEKSDDVADPPAQEKQKPNDPSELIVLSPHYDEKHHGLYVEKLEQAVRNPKVRNIALTGGYGTGKSSVIQGLIERIHSSKELKKIRPITISLPTIQIADESDSRDDSTDRIQREIVKQLLYRSNPRKMRGSQYRRITHVTTAQKATVCFIVAAILTFIFWFLAKPDWHWHWAQGGSLWGYWQPAVVQAISWGLAFYIDWIWVDKPTIKGLELGPTKLELDKNDSNYFDKYLNEIIYYFEVSGTNLVIFEDLDRFDNPYIFDALHELNELVNISLEQERFTEQKNPPVRFLYTTRDSIFEHKTKGIIENADTGYTHRLEIENRTKFFDVIVPIVPFSTSRNAYEYLKQMIDSSAFSIEIDRKLLEIVGSEISDYRLLANIVSEFQTFTEQIFASWGNEKETAVFFKDHANYLFAFVVYKNTHLTDYEKIQTGESKLDEIYIKFAKMRADVHKIIKEIFENLGCELKNRINHKINADFPYYYIVINNEWFSDFSRIRLWKRALHYDPFLAEPTIEIIDLDSNIIINDIVDYFGYDIFIDIMKKELTNREPHAENINDPDPYQTITSIDELREANTIYHLLRCKNLILPGDIQEKVDNFKTFIKEIFDRDQIIQELVKSNYINERFYAYASVFTKGFNNVKVFNFFIKNIGMAQPDIKLRFDEQDAREITYRLKHNKSLHATLKGALNVDLLLYLSASRWDDPDLILDNIKYLFKPTLYPNLKAQKNKQIRIELIKTILERWLSTCEKENNSHSNPLSNYNNVKNLLRKIIPLYPDIFLECFKDLTKKQKYILIDSALSASHLRTTINIKQDIKDNMQEIILFINNFNTKMDYADATIENMIDKSLGLNPLITHHHKEIMKRMVTRGTLRKISKRRINKIEHLNNAPKKAEFYDLKQNSWIPLQRITEYELELIETESLFGLKLIQAFLNSALPPGEQSPPKA